MHTCHSVASLATIWYPIPAPGPAFKQPSQQTLGVLLTFVYVAGPASAQHWVNASCLLGSVNCGWINWPLPSSIDLCQCTWYTGPSNNVCLMLISVKDNGPTLNHYWSCLLDYLCPRHSFDNVVRINIPIMWLKIIHKPKYRIKNRKL